MPFTGHCGKNFNDLYNQGNRRHEVFASFLRRSCIYIAKVNSDISLCYNKKIFLFGNLNTENAVHKSMFRNTYLDPFAIKYKEKK